MPSNTPDEASPSGIVPTLRERSLLATAADFMEMRLPNGSRDAVDLRALAARLEAFDG